MYISQLLNVTHTLQELGINYNDIGDNGMAVISEALQHNKSLATLRVSGCGLTVKGTVVCKLFNILYVYQQNLCNSNIQIKRFQCIYIYICCILEISLEFYIGFVY